MQHSSPPLFSVVVPVFNSAHTLQRLCQSIDAYFEQIGVSYEMILVNDGSADNTWEELVVLKKHYNQKLIAVQLLRNSGQHKAILCGFRFCRGQWVVTLDDDLQFLPQDISQLYARQKETDADLVYGIFIKKQHSLPRNVGSAALSWIFSRYASTTGRGSSFKLIRGKIVRQISDHHHPYTFIDELICWYASHIQYVEVPHYERADGKSGYTFFKLVTMGVNVIVSYTVLPLRFMIWFGMITFIVCLGWVCYFLFNKMMYNTPLGFTALIVSIFMSTGLIMFSIGILGEYINRLFNIQSRKPAYIVKEVLP